MKYRPGQGPWSKNEELDQTDLVHFEQLAHSFMFVSDERALLSRGISRLVKEVRRLHGWPESAEKPDTDPFDGANPADL